MMSYKAPNPYVESVAYKGNAPTFNSNSVMGMVGITPTGDNTKAVLVTSWSEYIEKFALSVETPFMANSQLSHAVYGFFQNGGSLLYVVRVADSATKATLNIGSETIPVEVTAKYAGAWGNKIAVEIIANLENGEPNISNPHTFNVYYADTLVESYYVSGNPEATNYYKTTINGYSNYVEIEALKEGYNMDTFNKATLAGGDDKISSINDEVYVNALKKFDNVHNLAAISIPGQSTISVVKGLLAYVKNKPILPVLEIPEASTEANSAIAFAKTNSLGKDAVIYAPMLMVADPLSSTLKTMEVPCVGHIMGVIARTIDTKGEWNAAAGTDAVIKGALGVSKVYTDEERGKLNEAGVNVLLTKPNYGTVIWGARSQSRDPELKYEPNLTLNHTLRRNISDAMQRFEFKNNNPSLWVDITAEITGLLETKRLAGAFAGTTPETCYYVKCDSTNNTQATIDKGQVIVEVGYAANKPAEFIIVRVAHQISN